MKVLYCGETFPEARRRLAARLTESGHEFLSCAEKDIVDYLDGVDVVIPAIARVDAALIERGSFGLIQQFGVGLDTVDIEAATRSGVWVARVPGSISGNAASVAEHAMLLMLTLSRKMADSRQALANRSVGVPLGAALLGKTACIVGMGNIGTALAVRLGACGMRLIVADDHPHRAMPDGVGIDAILSLEDLPQAVAGADYIAVCINYRAALRHLIGKTVLAAARPGGFLINVARGGLVDHEALLDALRSGRLAGAGLDVFGEEPVDPNHPLLKQNVVATPHIAGVTDASYDGTAKGCTENINRYARGETPLFTANAPLNPRRKIPAA